MAAPLRRFVARIGDMSAWLAWHRAGAWALIISNAVAGAWCLAAHRFRQLRGRPLVTVIVVAQLTALAQAIVGTVLITRYDLEAPDCMPFTGSQRCSPSPSSTATAPARSSAARSTFSIRWLPVHHGPRPA